MSWRSISLVTAKYLILLLCLVTVIITTPWGTQLTLRLLNHIDGLTVDYKSGALIRDLQVNSFQLHQESLDIDIKNLSTEVDFSCAWTKKLCIKSAAADNFSLRYMAEEQDKTIDGEQHNTNTLTVPFEMPFSIDIDVITLKKSHIIINDIDVSIDTFVSLLSIDKNTFHFIKPTIKDVTLLLTTAPQKTSHIKKEPVSYSINQAATSLNNTIRQLPEINLPLSLIIEQLTLDKFAINTVNANKILCQPSCSVWQSTHNQLSADWVNTVVNIHHFQTQNTTFSIHELTATANLTPPYQLAVTLKNEFNQVPWWPEIAESTQLASVQGALNNLEFELVSEGNLALKSQGNVDLINKVMPFNLTLDGQKIPTPLSLSHYGEYSTLKFNAQGDKKIQFIEIYSKIKGYSYNNAIIQLKAKQQKDQVTIEHFLFNDNDSASQLNITGNIGLLTKNLTWDLSAQSTGFSLPEISRQNVSDLLNNTQHSHTLTKSLPKIIKGRVKGKLASSGAWSNKTWSFALNDSVIEGHVNELPLNFSADIGLNQQGHLQPGKLSLYINNSALTLETSDHHFWDITGKIKLDNIAQWYPEIQGGLIGDFSVMGTQDNPIIKLNSQFTQLNWQDIRSDLLTVQANYLPMNNHQLQLSLNNNDLTLTKDQNEYSINNFAFDLVGNADKHHINTHWLGDISGEIFLSGHFNDTFSLWQSTIKKNSLTYQDITLENDKAFAVNIDLAHKEGTIASHCWQGKGVSLCLPNKTSLGYTGDISLDLSLDLSVVDNLILSEGTEVHSTLGGVVDVQWSANQALQAKARFDLSPGYLKVIDDFNEHVLSRWSHGVFTLAIDENELTNTLSLTAPNNLPLVRANSIITLNTLKDKDITKTANTASFSHSAINANIFLNKINLLPLQGILTEVITLEGKLNADLSVKGTLDSPLFNGDLALSHGKFRLLKNANTLDKISSSINIKNNQAYLNGNFYIEDKVASLKGDMSWEKSLAMNIELTSEKLPLIFPPQLAISVAPDLNISLAEKALTISGNIDVLEGNLNIEKLSESSVSLSDDVIIVDKTGKPVIKASSGFDIKTDINVNILPQFTVSGQGLESQLAGKLHISQQEKNPFQLVGNITSTHGTFKAYGQDLKIEKGEFTFNGPMDNPYLNLRATRTIQTEDVKVGIQITGLANALAMQFFSTPNMQTPEILSYLVRGRGLDTGTDNSSAASLLVGFGVSNSSGLFEQLERLPLINNISVDTEGEGDQTQATLSGYLGNRVYLKYGIGVYEPINELTVRLFILNQFWLEIVSGIEQSTDLYYSFSID